MLVIRALEALHHVLGQRPDERTRAVGPGRRLCDRCLDLVAGLCGRFPGELQLAARKMKVDRPAGRAALLDDVRERSGVVPALAE